MTSGIGGADKFYCDLMHNEHITSKESGSLPVQALRTIGLPFQGGSVACLLFSVGI